MSETNTNLVPVFTGEIAGKSAQLVDARTLHEFLEATTKFADWIYRRISEYEFVEDQDYLILKIEKNLKGGRPYIDYHLTLDMAKELSMVERNDKGKQARRYFIEMERLALESQSKPTSKPKLKTPMEENIETSSGILEITSNFLALAKLLDKVGEEAVAGADNATYKLCGYSPLDYLASNKSTISVKNSVETIFPKETLTREQYVTATTIGNEVGRNAIAVNLRLYDMGFLNAVPNGFTKRGKPKSIYVLTEEGKKYGKLTTVQTREGDEFEQIKWSKEAVVPLVRKAFEEGKLEERKAA